ncbi:MAG: hypothetical protein F6K24_04260 [Okeania sp. SIO2D1]|nr:hypothetical protein [Okeania sp. SIO2D1]
MKSPSYFKCDRHLLGFIILRTVVWHCSISPSQANFDGHAPVVLPPEPMDY